VVRLTTQCERLCKHATVNQSTYEVTFGYFGRQFTKALVLSNFKV